MRRGLWIQELITVVLHCNRSMMSLASSSSDVWHAYGPDSKGGGGGGGGERQLALPFERELHVLRALREPEGGRAWEGCPRPLTHSPP